MSTKMPRRVALLSTMLFAGVVVASCGTGGQEQAGGDAATRAAGAFPVTIQHKYGRTTIPAKPERVISLGLTDHDVALALGATPVAISPWFGQQQPNCLWPWARDEVGQTPPDASRVWCTPQVV